MIFQNLILVPALSLSLVASCGGGTFKGANNPVTAKKTQQGEVAPAKQGAANAGGQVGGGTSGGTAAGDKQEKADDPLAAINNAINSQQVQTTSAPNPSNNDSAPQEKSGGGNNILPWIFGGVAAIGAAIAFGTLANGGKCDNATLTTPRAEDPANPQHQSPFSLANNAYRGGIIWGSYGPFCEQYGNGGRLNEFVDAAVRAGKLDRRLADCEYRNSLKMQLDSICQ
jgi:hypothetical protein